MRLTLVFVGRSQWAVQEIATLTSRMSYNAALQDPCVYLDCFGHRPSQQSQSFFCDDISNFALRTALLPSKKKKKRS